MTESDLPTSLSRSRLSQPKRQKPTIEAASPIAADGGFGPMYDDESEEESDESADTVEEIAQKDVDDGFGDDFDDFEAGAGDEDFGEFDEGFQQPSTPDGEFEEPEPPPPSIQPLPPSISLSVSNTNATFRGTMPAHLIIIYEGKLKLMIISQSRCLILVN